MDECDAIESGYSSWLQRTRLLEHPYVPVLELLGIRDVHLRRLVVEHVVLVESLRFESETRLCLAVLLSHGRKALFRSKKAAAFPLAVPRCPTHLVDGLGRHDPDVRTLKPPPLQVLEVADEERVVDRPPLCEPNSTCYSLQLQ